MILPSLRSCKTQNISGDKEAFQKTNGVMDGASIAGTPKFVSPKASKIWKKSLLEMDVP